MSLTASSRPPRPTSRRLGRCVRRATTRASSTSPPTSWWARRSPRPAPRSTRTARLRSSRRPTSTPRSSTALPTSVPSPTAPTRSTRRWRSSTPGPPRASSSTTSSWSSPRASSRPTSGGCGSSTSSSPAPRGGSWSCTPSRCPRRSARPRRPSRSAHRSPRRSLQRMTATGLTDADRAASGVAWDIEPFVDGRGDAGVDALLDDAEQRADAIGSYRDRIGSLDAAELATLMQELATIAEAIGKAGSYAGLRFSTDTQDPARGALLARTEERATAISNELLFVDLEWAELSEEQVAPLLTDPALEFCKHHLAAMRRYRDHLLSEPEERVLADKATTGKSAWARLFSELTSTIEVDVDGEAVSLEEGLSRIQSPDREVRRTSALAVTAALEPGLRTRAFVFNTLLADKNVDDRLRRYDGWLASRNLENEASDESVQALVDAVVHRYDIPQRWYALKAQLLGVDRLADYDRMATIAESEDVFG